MNRARSLDQCGISCASNAATLPNGTVPYLKCGLAPEAERQPVFEPNRSSGIFSDVLFFHGPSGYVAVATTVGSTCR